MANEERENQGGQQAPGRQDQQGGQEMPGQGSNDEDRGDREGGQSGGAE